MSLTDTINNTNTQKENVKTVATNIDNKLVELGGERATNLADVVNKIENAVTQRKKVAKGKHTVQTTGLISSETIQMNLNFNPTIIFVKISSLPNHVGENIFASSLDVSKIGAYFSSRSSVTVSINDISADKFKLNVYQSKNECWIATGSIIEWIAIE